MKKSVKIFSLVMAAALAAALLGACGGASAPDSSAAAPAAAGGNAAPAEPEITLVAATPTAIDSVNHFIVHKANELVQQKSGGRVMMNIYETGQLGNERETMEGVQAGTIDFYVTLGAAFVPFVPNAGVFDLPNAFPTLEIARKVLNGDILKEVVPDYEKAGFKMFGFCVADFRHTTANKPFNSMADFAGFKIRTMQNANHIAYWSALGAAPTPMNYSEVYIALQQGAIDGEENPFDLIVGDKFYEPQKYVIETRHLAHAVVMMMSKVEYDSLPDDIKPVAEASVREALDYGLQIADERIISRRKIVTDYGLTIMQISPELRGKMIEALKPVYDKMRGDVGSGLVDKLLAEIAKAEEAAK